MLSVHRLQAQAYIQVICKYFQNLPNFLGLPWGIFSWGSECGAGWRQRFNTPGQPSTKEAPVSLDKHSRFVSLGGAVTNSQSCSDLQRLQRNETSVNHGEKLLLSVCLFAFLSPLSHLLTPSPCFLRSPKSTNCTQVFVSGSERTQTRTVNSDCVSYCVKCFFTSMALFNFRNIPCSRYHESNSTNEEQRLIQEDSNSGLSIQNVLIHKISQGFIKFFPTLTSYDPVNDFILEQKKHVLEQWSDLRSILRQDQAHCTGNYRKVVDSVYLRIYSQLFLCRREVMLGGMESPSWNLFKQKLDGHLMRMLERRCHYRSGR